MKKDKLYLYTLLAVSTIVFIIGFFSMNLLVETSAKKLLEVQIKSSKREAKEFSKLISLQLENGTSQAVMIKNIQKSIENADLESGFICMFDWSGVEICHPNPMKIGKQTSPNESFVRPVNEEINSEDFYSILTSKKEIGGVRNFENSDRKSEIIYLYPVKNTDWIIAAHANISILEKQIKHLKLNFRLVYAITSILIILLTLTVVRFFGSRYEKKLEDKNDSLYTEVLSLSKMNRSLSAQKSKIAEKTNVLENKSKNRILTYLRDQIISVEITDIAYINTQNSITSVITFDGKKYTSNTSLDELYTIFDNELFFRANRQYIISITAIEKIVRYGNSQLKIITQPESKTLIIISKNKAAAFKKWLNK